MIMDWIIAIGGSDVDGNILYKFTGTAKEAKKKLMDIVLRDREDNAEDFDHGTSDMENIIQVDDCENEFYAYNCFFSYRVDYIIKSLCEIQNVETGVTIENNADRIRCMNDEELLNFLCSIETYGHGKAISIEHGKAISIEKGVAMCSVSDVAEWLHSPVEKTENIEKKGKPLYTIEPLGWIKENGKDYEHFMIIQWSSTEEDSHEIGHKAYYLSSDKCFHGTAKSIIENQAFIISMELILKCIYEKQPESKCFAPDELAELTARYALSYRSVNL